MDGKQVVQAKYKDSERLRTAARAIENKRKDVQWHLFLVFLVMNCPTLQVLFLRQNGAFITLVANTVCQ